MSPPLSERCTVETLAAGFSRVQHTLRDRGSQGVRLHRHPFRRDGRVLPRDAGDVGKVNGWLRRQAAAGDYDGLVDFAKVLEDPEKPGYMLPAYDSATISSGTGRRRQNGGRGGKSFGISGYFNPNYKNGGVRSYGHPCQLVEKVFFEYFLGAAHASLSVASCGQLRKYRKRSSAKELCSLDSRKPFKKGLTLNF